MIEFQFPILLWLIIPYSILVVWIFYQTRVSIQWITSNVSERFIDSFTAFNKTYKMISYFLFVYLTGIFLIIASADPEKTGKEENVASKGNIILAIDASQSMWAGDTFPHPITKKKPYDRLTQAIEAAQDFIDLYPNYSYGVVTFSSKAVVHSSPQNDPILAKTILHSINIHKFESSGSSFKAVFQKLITIVSKDPALNTQVLFISDGEITTRTPENYSEELEILNNFGIRIHAIGVGKKAGGSVRYFLHYYNVQKETTGENKKDDSTGEKKVYYKEETVKNLTTKRDDSTLRAITEKTGGKYIVLEKGEYVAEFEKYLKMGTGSSAQKKASSQKINLSRFFILPAFIFFLMHSFVFFRRKKYIYEN